MTVTLAGLLGACSVSSPLQVRSTGSGSVAPTSIALMISDDEAGKTRAQYGAALQSAFADRQIGIDPAAPVIAEYAFSIGDATDGLLVGKPKKTDTGQQPDWEATPRKKGRFDKCDAKRMRGTLVLFDRTSGNIIYRGEADQIECDFSEIQVKTAAEKLVADAVNALGS